MIRNGQDNKKKQAMLKIILLQSGKIGIVCTYIFFKCFSINFIIFRYCIFNLNNGCIQLEKLGKLLSSRHFNWSVNNFGIKFRNLKIDFNTGGTQHQVKQ